MTRWRATARRWSFDDAGDRYGDWVGHREAVEQAAGWSSEPDVVATWLEAGAVGVGVVLVVELREAG